jgi:hypothetical protein
VGTRVVSGAALSQEREPESRGTRDGPGATLSREGEPKPRGHVAAPELPRAGSLSPSHRDMWQPQSCSQPGGGSRCLDLKLVRGVPGP